jgi:tRNA A-37 threonylcarbamoyl transferase component Bud32
MDERAAAGSRATRRRSTRRRPSGEPPPLPREPGWLGWAWAAVVVVVLGAAISLVLAATDEPFAIDVAILEAFARIRSPALTDVARALHSSTDVAVLLLVRLAAALVLAVVGRFRHLVAFLAVLVATDWIAARLLSVELPDPSVSVLGDPGTFAFPSRTIAAIAVTLTAMAFAFVPRGRGRMWFRVGAHLVIGLFVGVELYLATDYPTAALYGWALGTVVAQATFRWFVPEEVFPVRYGSDGKAAHLDLGGERRDAVVRAMQDQLGLTVTEVEPFGLEGSGGSSPLRMTLEDGSRVFGKIYATSHARADRWYRVFRTILYGQLEDETPMGSVRRLVTYEHYALLFLERAGIRVAHVHGVVELTPNREYLIATEFFEGAKNLGDSEIDDTVIDEGLTLVRQLWEAGVAHRDIKPANLLVRDGHLQLVDVSALEVRPSPWRQAVDLANMMMTLALRTDPDRVYERALTTFTEDEIAEGFASTVGLTIPTELQTKMKADGRPLLARFRELAPRHEPISIQRWSMRRLALTGSAVFAIVVGSALFADAIRAGIT